MKKHRKCKKIIAFVTVLFIAFVAVIGLHKTGIYRFDFLKDIYKKIDFQLSTNELNIPQDALSFSVYDIETSLDKGTQRKTTENELPSLTQCTA